MGRDRRSIRDGYRILLVAMAIQGLTPDHSDLASSRLLRLVISSLLDGHSADGGPAPSPSPIPRGEDDGVPVETGSTVAADAAHRVRLDNGGWRSVLLLPVGLFDRPTRSASHPLRPPGPLLRGADGLILSLCRFLC